MKATGVSPAKADAAPTFTVTMTSVGTSRFDVVKVIKALNEGMSLRKAVELMDNVPSIVLENVAKDQADAAKEKLIAAGASVEVK